MSKKIVAFHSYQLGERGTEVHMYKMAKYNRDILGNDSIIISTSSRPTPSLNMFRSEFKTLLYPEVWVPDGINLNLKTSLGKICDENKVTHLWATKGGESDGIFPTNVFSIAACIFRMDEPHGNLYTGICKYISDKHGGDFPYVYPIVEKESQDITSDYRAELGIPKDAIVFGRHGGKDSFSLQFVKQVIYDVIDKRTDIYFVFMNTERFIHHPRVFHLEWSSDFDKKAKFINTCDAMIHARLEGEIFSLAIAEFSKRNKPIITWKPQTIPQYYDTGHLYVLGDNAYYYNDSNDLKDLLLNISKNELLQNDWDVYKDTYSPENVMNEFNKKFLL